MKQLLLLLIFIHAAGMVFSQSKYVYTIKADSVRITGCDSSELIIENHTQNIPGFLFNTGNGRTIFKRALVQLDDTTFLLGGDTLRTTAFSLWKRNGNAIYNINTGAVGIHRDTPKVLLDLPGPVNIDDTSAYRIKYHPVLRIGDWEDWNFYNGENGPVAAYAGLYAGDSSGANNSGTYATLIGCKAGLNNMGVLNTFLGFGAGMDNPGDENTFIGYLSGENNTPDSTSGFPASSNSFFGAQSGQNNSGANNTFLGVFAGRENYGTDNTFTGNAVGAGSSGIWNCFYGSNSGQNNTGDYNSFYGNNSGRWNVGSNNTAMGNFAGANTTGSGNVSLGGGSGYTIAGSENVLVGDAAGGYTNGTGNTYIGANTAYNLYAITNGLTLLGSGSNATPSGSSISDATAIGYNAIVQSSNTMVFGDSAVSTWLFNTKAAAAAGKALVVGYNSSNGNGAYLTTGGVWTNASDYYKKENFSTLNSDDLLDKIEALPVTRWNYKGLTEQHIGPMAQDFHRLFNVGTDDKAISTIDPSGIALAGIQGLYKKWKAAEQQAAGLQQRMEDLETRIRADETKMAAQQAVMGKLLEKVASLEATIETNHSRR